MQRISLRLRLTAVRPGRVLVVASAAVAGAFAVSACKSGTAARESTSTSTAEVRAHSEPFNHHSDLPRYLLTGQQVDGCFDGPAFLAVYPYSSPRRPICLRPGAALRLYLTPTGGPYWQPPTLEGSAVDLSRFDRIETGGLLTVHAVQPGRARLSSVIAEFGTDGNLTSNDAPGGAVQGWVLRLRVT